MTKNKVLPLAAMTGMLVVAYLLDKASTAVHNFFSSTFRTSAGYSLLILFEILFAGLAIFLVWLVLGRSNRSFLVGSVFIGIGLLGLFVSSPFRHFLPSIPFPQMALYRYQIQDLPFFQRYITYFLWNINNGIGMWHFFTPIASLQFFTRTSALTFILGVIKLIQKPT